MSMIFSQNGGKVGSVPMNVSHHSQPRMGVPSVVGTRTASSARSAPRGIRQLFSLGDIMSNPGAPCKACGS